MFFCDLCADERLGASGARVSTCGHCGAEDVGAYAAGYSSAEGHDLCHPNAAGRPDCYRLVTVYHHSMNCVPCARSQPGGTP